MSNGDSTRSEREALLGGSDPSRKPKRGWFKALAIGGGALLVLLVVLVAFAPGIAGRFAPGIIQNSAAKQFQGRVKVADTTFSWGGPQTIGPIEISDPSGKPVGQITIKAGVGLLGLLGTNLGTTTLSGNLNLVRNADGSTNLQKALSPVNIKVPVGGPAASTGPTLPLNYTAALNVESLEVKYTELDAAGQPGRETALTGIKGTASVSTVAPGAAAIDMAGNVAEAGKPGGAVKISGKIDGFTDGNGNLTPQTAKVNADVDIAGLPAALLDALAGQKGLLGDALGATVSANVKASGNASAGTANVMIDAPNVSARLAVKLENDVVRLEKPGQFVVRSTKFAAAVPAVKDALVKAGMTIDQWPGIEGTVDALALPVPKGDLAAADFRGAAVGITIGTTPMSGTLVAPGESASKPFNVAPLKASVAAADLAKGIEIKAQTNATVGGQSAGAINIAVTAAGLLNESGHLGLLKGTMPRSVNADVSAQGVSMALVQPLVAGMNLPVDLNTDLGPTLDAKALVQTTEGGATSVNATLQSRNVTLSAPLTLKDNVLTTAGGPITLSVQSAAGVVGRVLMGSGKPQMGADAAQPFMTRVGGTGAIEATITDLSLPLPGKDAKTGAAMPLDMAKASAVVKARVSNLAVWMRAPEGAAAGAPTEPVNIETVAMDITAKPGVAPVVNIQGKMAHGSRPFDLAGTLQVAGLDAALGGGASKPGALVPGVQTVRVSGQVLATGVPTSLIAVVQPAARADLARGVLGDTVNATVLFDQPSRDGAGPKPDAARQLVVATLTGTGLNASVAADLNATELRLRALNAEATLRPETFSALGNMASAPAGAAGADPAAKSGAGTLANIRVNGPAKVLVSAEPVTIPIKVVGNSVEPQFASAGVLNATVAIPGTFAVSNVPVGDKLMAGGMKDFSLVAGVPLAMLAPGASGGQKLTATGKGSLILDERTSVAELDLKATAAADLSSVDASVNLAGVNTAALDSVLGEPGLASGALGETATIGLTAQRSGGADKPMAIVATIVAPRLKTGPLELRSEPTRFSLAKPTSVQWTIEPAWAERYLLARKDKDGRPVPPTMKFASPVNLAVNVRALAIAIPETRGGLAVTGPLKPGVFALDADVSLPRVDVLLLDASGPPRPATLNDVKAAVRSAPDGSIAFDASVASVDAGETRGQAGQPVSVKGSVKGLAQANGIIDTRNALVNFTATATKFPTAVVDAIAGMKGQIVQTLGTEMDLSVKAVDASLGAGSGGAGGSVDVRLNTRQAGQPGEQGLFAVGGPIREAVLDVGADGARLPLNVALTRFRYESNTNLMKMLPLFASVSKNMGGSGASPAGDSKPVSITSNNLRVPVDSRMENLNGDIQVDLGLIQYEFKEVLGEFLDAQVFSAGKEPQKPIAPFTVAVRNGIATYERFDIPVRSFVLSTRGTIDLVKREVDVITYIPTVAASKGLLGQVSGDASRGLGKVLPNLLAEGTMIPIRAKGPMDNPRIYADMELFFKEFGGNLTKQPEKIIENVIDLFGKKKK
ncbi:MAG: hypothetical protein ACKVS8_08560 [Phycisphaerales bacterium]